LKHAYSLRFSRRSGRFKYHPVTYVAKRLSRNMLEAIDMRTVSDQPGQSAADFSAGVEQLPIEVRLASERFSFYRRRSRKDHCAVIVQNSFAGCNSIDHSCFFASGSRDMANSTRRKMEQLVARDCTESKQE